MSFGNPGVALILPAKRARDAGRPKQRASKSKQHWKPCAPAGTAAYYEVRLREYRRARDALRGIP
jgi:hypothetical protein